MVNLAKCVIINDDTVFSRADDCRFLKLVGGSIYEEDPMYGLGIFKRIKGTDEFEALDDSGFRVWRDTHTESYVVGETNH